MRDNQNVARECGRTNSSYGTDLSKTVHYGILRKRENLVYFKVSNINKVSNIKALRHRKCFHNAAPGQ